MTEQFRFNICYCGTEAGYPHDPTCPSPLYNAAEGRKQLWLEQFEANQKQNNTTPPETP